MGVHYRKSILQGFDASSDSPHFALPSVVVKSKNHATHLV